jgi:effector-binding domain-containing protein
MCTFLRSNIDHLSVLSSSRFLKQPGPQMMQKLHRSHFWRIGLPPPFLREIPDADTGGNMNYQVTMTDVETRPTAVVPATTTWQEFPTLWRELSDEVWACLHAGGISRGCRVIMLYWDDVPHVEVGVELLVPCPLIGRVRASALPAGQAAMTVHWGAYSRLGEAHQAVIDWCAAQGKRKTGTRWEVYGPHNDDPAKVWTEVYWLLA